MGVNNIWLFLTNNFINPLGHSIDHVNFMNHWKFLQSPRTSMVADLVD